MLYIVVNYIKTRLKHQINWRGMIKTYLCTYTHIGCYYSEKFDFIHASILSEEND